MGHLLEVKNLRVSYHSYEGEIQSVRGISFALEPGEIAAIIGNSGCGKSVAAKSIMGLIQTPPGEIKQGSEILFAGRNLLSQTPKQWQEYRGKECALISRELFFSLNPTLPVGRQIIEKVMEETKSSKREACQIVRELFEQVGIDCAAKRLKQYPHEFTGILRQQLMIAFAMISKPNMLIVDDAANDALSQTGELLKKLREEKNMSVLFVSDDIQAAGGIAEKILVMYAGKIVESGNVEDVCGHPRHPYTQMLLNNKRELGESMKAAEEKNFQLMDLPKGCAFSPFCPRCMKICKQHEPPVFEFEDGHTAPCWLYHTLAEVD